MVEATELLLVWSGQAFPFAVDLGLKSLLLCSAALLFHGTVGRRRVLARSAVWNACLLGLALLPAAAMFFPQMQWSPFAPRRDVSPLSLERQEAEKSAPLERNDVSASSGERTNVFSQSEGRPYERVTREENVKSPAPAIDAQGVALLVYTIVAAGMLVRLSLSLAAVSRLRRSGVPLAESQWSERLARWRERFGIGRQVQLLKSDRVDVPVVVGWRRPAILAPERLAAAETRTIDAVLLHELAHVRRGDYGWNLLLRLVQALYWPNPLVWLMARAIGRVREQACDEVCIHWLGGAEAYRATLLELAGGLLRRRPLAALGMAMARSSRLQRRLAQIDASSGRPQSQSRRPLRIAALAFAALVAGALGALRVTGGAAADEPKKRPMQVVGEVDEQPVSAAKAPEQKSKPSAVEPPANAAGSAPMEKPEQPLKVRVDKVRREDFVVQALSPGTLKSSRSTSLYARLAGTIAARHAAVGDRVKAGQVLAEIEAPEFDGELEQAMAAAEEAVAIKDQAQGKLDEAAAGLEEANANVAKSKADLERAASQVGFSKKAYARLHELAKQKAVDVQSVEEKESEALTPQRVFAAAEPQVDAAKALVKHAEATVTVAKAGLQIAQLHDAAARRRLAHLQQQIRFRQIEAPADGVITQEAAEPGSPTKPGGEPLFVITGTNRVTATATVPENMALLADPGDPAVVFVGGKKYGGQVSRVAYALDPRQQALPIEIDLDNPDGRLRPGMQCEAVINLETHPGVLTVADKFLREMHDERQYCVRVVDGRAVRTEFKANLNIPRTVPRCEIKSGLSEGDLVVIEVLPPKGKAWHLKGAPVEIVGSASDDDLESER